MNNVLMKRYIEFVADRLLVALDLPKVPPFILQYPSLILYAFFCRFTMLKILLILWRTFHLKGKQTFLRRKLVNIKNLVSWLTKVNTYSLLMLIFKSPKAIYLYIHIYFLYVACYFTISIYKVYYSKYLPSHHYPKIPFSICCYNSHSLCCVF